MEKLTYTHNDAAAKVLASYYETPPLAYVRSYGCQQNVNDGEKIKGVLQDVGYGLCDTVEQADLILLIPAPCVSMPSSAYSAMWGRSKSLRKKTRG